MGFNDIYLALYWDVLGYSRTNQLDRQLGLSEMGVLYIYPQIAVCVGNIRKDHEPVDFGVHYVQTKSDKPIFQILYIKQWDVELMAIQLGYWDNYIGYVMRMGRY